MRRIHKFIALICLAALISPMIIKPAATFADAVAAGAANAASAAPLSTTGNSVPFDGSGKFVDLLDNANYIFYQSGITQAGGSITGPGEVVFSSGNSDFQSITIDTTFNKWVLNYNDHDLSVFEAVYDASTGTFTDTKKVDLVRQLRPDLMSGKDTDKATYVSGPITPGTKYLRVVLPQADFFADPQYYGDYKLDAITFKNSSSASKPLDSIVDHLSDFSHFVSGVDTSNLNVNDLTKPDRIWDARTFASTSYLERKDATKEDHSMTYSAPDGKEFQNVYVEGYHIFIPSSLYEVWTSKDGVSYTNSTVSRNYVTAPFPYNGDWIPTVLKISSLPEGTKYVQIRLPAYTSDELWGMKHPRMTKVVLGYGDPGSGNPADPGDPGTPTDPVVTYPAETTIQYISQPVTIDGVVETDPSGAPAGDWAGAAAENIAGLVDANGDQHSAKVYLKYDYDNLYVGAKIKDPTPMQNSNTGTNIWGGDNLEIFLGTEDLDYTLYPDKKLTMIPSDVQVVLSGGIDNGPQFYTYQNGVFSYPNITMNVRPDSDGKGYSIEAAIPLNVLGINNPWDHKKMIMDPVLNDGAYPKRGQWGWTTNEEAAKKSRSLWGLANLEPTNAPEAEISVAASIASGTNVVTVTGQTLSVQSKDVTIVVSDKNGNIAYIDQAPSDAQGNYSFNFPMNGDLFSSGLYTVTVGGDGIRRTNSTTFTLSPDKTPPADVAHAIVAAGDEKLKLSWTDPADADYDHALVTVQGQSAAPVTIEKGVQGTVIGNLTNDSTYTILIQTVDLTGNISGGIVVTGTPAVPEVSGVHVTEGDKSLKVTWTDPTDSEYDHTLVSLEGRKSDKLGTLTVGKGVQNADFLKLKNDSEYMVTIETVDKKGNISKGVTVTAIPNKTKKH